MWNKGIGNACLRFLALYQLADKIACSRDDKNNAKNNQGYVHVLTPSHVYALFGGHAAVVGDLKDVLSAKANLANRCVQTVGQCAC